MEEQAKQLLQASNPLAALQLAARAAAAGESLSDGAFAEIGYALLQGNFHAPPWLKHTVSCSTAASLAALNPCTLCTRGVRSDDVIRHRSLVNQACLFVTYR